MCVGKTIFGLRGRRKGGEQPLHFPFVHIAERCRGIHVRRGIRVRQVLCIPVRFQQVRTADVHRTQGAEDETRTKKQDVARHESLPLQTGKKAAESGERECGVPPPGDAAARDGARCLLYALRAAERFLFRKASA